MDDSQRRSLPLNLDLSDLFIGLSHIPMPSLIASHKMSGNSEIKTLSIYSSWASKELTHRLKINDVENNVKPFKNNTSFVRNVINAFSSITSVVSRIPNYMTSINNTLSVTVVPNGDIISKESILKSLTTNNEIASSRMEPITKIFECMKNKKLHNKLTLEGAGSPDMQEINVVLKEKLLDVFSKLPKKYLDDDENYFQHYTCPSMKKNTKLINNDEIDNTICDDINSTLLANNKVYHTMDKIKMSNQKFRMDNKSFDRMGLLGNNIDEEPVNLKTSMKKITSPKSWKKYNSIVRSRGKGHGRVQLKKSGVCRVKHRKKRSKQIICNNIEDDIGIWKEETQNVETVLDTCTTSLLSTDDDCLENEDHIVESQQIHQNYLSEKFVTRIAENIFEHPVQSLNNNIHDFRSRNLSESSIDSEDSCFIVFEDESKAESTDYDYESSNDNESENDENENESNHKVRFTLEPTVHIMVRWNFAYRAARKGPWEEKARDRERFHVKINYIGKILNPILMEQHRQQIYQNRFAISHP